MDAWRKLVHLAFDISASDERTLPDTLATIIEGQKSRKQEELQLDLNAILEEAHHLREEGDRIMRIRNASDSWETFNGHFRHETQLRNQAAKAYADLSESLGIEEDRLKEALEASGGALTEAENQTDALARIKQDNHTAVTETAAEVRASGKLIDSLLKDINAANATLNEFPAGTPHREIIEDLEEHITQQQQAINGYNDKAVAQKEYATVCDRLDSNSRQAKRLDDQLTNRTPTLLDDLSVDDASILHSMNHSLGATHGALTGEQEQAFSQFSQQFRPSDGYLMLGHQSEDCVVLGGIPYHEYDAEKIDRICSAALRV